jgi:hypothetical protein
MGGSEGGKGVLTGHARNPCEDICEVGAGVDAVAVAGCFGRRYDRICCADGLFSGMLETGNGAGERHRVKTV